MRVLSVVVLVLALANGTDAQPSDPPVELAFGVGYARALHADLDYGAPVYSGSLRFRVQNLVFEAEGAYWRHAETRFRTAVNPTAQ